MSSTEKEDESPLNEEPRAEARRQDVICDAIEESESHVGNVLLRDLLQLHCRLWKDKEGPSEQQISDVAKRIVRTIQVGCDYVLPADVESPKTFVDGTARFVSRQEDGTWSPVEEEDAIAFVTKSFTEYLAAAHTSEGDKAAASDSAHAKAETDESKQLGEEEKNPGADVATIVRAGDGEADADTFKLEKADVTAEKESFVPSMDDVVLLKRGEDVGRAPINRTGTSHLVAEIGRYLSKKKLWIKSSIEDRRAEAALHITEKLAEAHVRILGQSGDGEKLMYLKEIENVDAAEFILVLLFDSILSEEDKLASITYLLGVDQDNYPEASLAAPSTIPIEQPSIHDVLLGRGGMTNQHPGNRRFRDIVALHRPDYIRAIKVEKPSVARRIVRAIRCGNPPGRFLKKDSDGLWYDVGDKQAAEKTSQALREKKTAEKEAQNTGNDKKRPASTSPGGHPASKQRLDSEAASDDLSSQIGPSEIKVPPISAYGDFDPVKVNQSIVPRAKSKKTKQSNESRSPVGDDVAFEAKASTAGNVERVDKDGNILVTDHDILSGRGGLVNHHIGNKRFRDIIALHRPDYVRAPKINKPAVARLIVKAIRNSDPPGRFLKKDEKTGKWFDIGDKRAAEKASQALREKSQEERDKARREQLHSIPISLYTNPELYRATSEALKALIPDASSPVKQEDIPLPQASPKEEEEEQSSPEKDAVTVEVSV